MATVDGLRLRRELGRKLWVPPIPFGPNGWHIWRKDHTAEIIVSTDKAPDDYSGPDWTHASMSRVGGLPTYEDMCLLHRAVWGETGYAYQVHAPSADHVNINEVLHLWGRADGTRVLPNFGMLGTI